MKRNSLFLVLFLIITSVATVEAKHKSKVRFGFDVDIEEPTVTYYEPVPRYEYVPYPRYYDGYVIIPHPGQVMYEDPYYRPLLPLRPFWGRGRTSFGFSIGR